MKREVVRGRIGDGGLGLFNFSEFFISLKLNLMTKVVNPDVAHNWKCIFITQLKFSHKTEISIENTLVRDNCEIVQDILSSYVELK